MSDVGYIPPGYQPFAGDLDKPPEGYAPVTGALDAPGANYHGSLLPFSTDAQGKPYFDWNAGISGALRSAFTLPGQVASGEVQTPYSSTGQMDPDLMPRTAGLASTLAMDAVPTQLPRTAAPTGQELRAVGKAQYNALDNSNLAVKSSELGNLGSDISQNLQGTHFIDDVAAPQTHNLVSGLSAPSPGGYMSYPQLMKLRERFTDLTMAGGSEGKAASVARGQFDTFLQNLQDSQLQRGTLLGQPTMTGPEAAQLFQDARGNYQGSFKSDELAGGLGKGDTGMLQKAETRAAVTNSGQNEGNLIRQRIATFLGNEDNLVGYSPEEIASLRAVANGSSYQDALRFLGNRGSMMSAVGALLGRGGVESGIGVGIGQGVAKVFKGLEAGVARRGLQGVDEMVRQNTPLGQTVAPPPPPPTWLPGQPYPSTAPFSPGRPQLISPPGSGRLVPPGLLTPNQNQPIPWWQLEGRA
jgi:hypothetical protein